MLTASCFGPAADPRGQPVPLPDRLRGLHLRPAEGPAGAGGERRHLPGGQLRADQHSGAALWGRRPRRYHPRLSEGRCSSACGTVTTPAKPLLTPERRSQGLTAYHDIALDKCYITELNTTTVMPPRSLWELLVNVKVRRGEDGAFPGRGRRSPAGIKPHCVCVFCPAEGDVPASHLHRPGGDGGDGEGEEHEAAGALHPQALLRQRNLPPPAPQPTPT